MTNILRAALAFLTVLVMTACGSPVPGDPVAATTVPDTTTSQTSTTTTEEPTTTSAEPLEDLDESVPEADGAFSDSELDGEVTLEYTADYLQMVIEDADEMWVDYFETLPNAVEPYVTYVIVEPGEEYVSACDDSTTITSDFANAFYCSADENNGEPGAIWLPLETFTQMWNGDIFGRQSAEAGDFAAAVVVAHEFGHHIQDELRTQFRLPQIEDGNGDKIVERELIADCFAGVWAYSAYEDGELEDNDLDEAVAGLEVLGDSEEGGADPHGSAEERVDAFLLGYEDGAPADCVNEYWPGVEAN